MTITNDYSRVIARVSRHRGDRSRAVYVDSDERALDPRNRRAGTISASNPPAVCTSSPLRSSLSLERRLDLFDACVHSCSFRVLYRAASARTENSPLLYVYLCVCTFGVEQIDRSQTVPLPLPCVSRCVVQSRSPMWLTSNDDPTSSIADHFSAIESRPVWIHARFDLALCFSLSFTDAVDI